VGSFNINVIARDKSLANLNQGFGICIGVTLPQRERGAVIE
jgi:hypothetical protein